MRILLAPDGSRGDVQPLLVLGERLVAAGHQVSMAGPAGFAAGAAAAGLTFHPWPFDLEAWSAARAADMTAGGRRSLALLNEMFGCMLDSQFALLPEIAGGVDWIVGGGPQLAGSAVAEVTGAHFVQVLYAPTPVPSGDHLPVMLAPRRLPRCLRRVIWWATRMIYQRMFGARLNRQRAALGLAPARDIYGAVMGRRALLACDPEIAPRPATSAMEVIQLGAFHRLGAPPLPARIEAFLAAGPAPVYVGFGSMRDGTPDQTTRLVVDAAGATGVRVILGAGWAGLGNGDLPDSVLAIGDVAHASLFPRMAGVVHHGGAGTTAAAARAGVPQLLVPHLADQPFFASRITAVGLGPPPIRRARLSGERLAAGLRALTSDPEMSARAAAVGDRLRRRDATGAAVDLLAAGLPRTG